jgi:hypothetical protein
MKTGKSLIELATVERIGGEVIELAANDWRVIAEAA